MFLGSPCPQDVPYVYHNGDYCCKYNYEKVHEPQGELCDGGPIGIDSLCCVDDNFRRCPDSPCSNYYKAEAGMNELRITGTAEPS